MRCSDAQKNSTSYLDGELSADASAAVRGHLRTCAACEALFEQEAELIEAAQKLAPLDPPESVWEGIQKRLAAEEVRDSQSSALLRWLRWRRGPALAFGLGVCAAAAIVVMRPWQGQGAQPAASLVKADHEASQVADSLSFVEQREVELSLADRDYIQTIQELRELVEEDRSVWSEREAAVIDEQLAAFHRRAIGERLAVTSAQDIAGVASEGRAALYQSYRAEIAFLQATLAGDLPELP